MDPTNFYFIKRQNECRASIADLPQELRDMVYSHLWRDGPRIQPSFGRKIRNTFEVCYGNISPDADPQCGLPKWLLLSKGICQEGLKELSKNTIWSCWLYGCEDIQDRCSQLVNPLFATNVTFNMDTYVRAVPQGQAVQALFKTSEPVLPLKSITSQLSPAMKHLTLKFELDVNTDITSWANINSWAIDLSLFDHINLRLDSLTLVGTMPTGKDPCPLVTDLTDAFITELTRLGYLLVDRKAHINVDENITKYSSPIGTAYWIDIKVKLYRD